MQAAVGRSTVNGFLSGDDSKTVRLGLWSTGREERHGCSRHGDGSKWIKAITTVDFHLNGVATSGPIDRGKTVCTIDTADGQIDQAEFVGHDPSVGLRPDGSVSRIGQGKANVQGCIFQSIAVRVAGYGLVCNPIVLLGLSGENRHQQNCGQKE